MNFRCPYCDQPTTITEPNRFTKEFPIKINSHEMWDVWFLVEAIVCPNEDCNKLYLRASLTDQCYGDYNSYSHQYVHQTWNLLPESVARVLPEYIPAVIQEDYYESCRIRDLSPKASATLSRRCLQGMIRDFWQVKVKTNRLCDEIREIKDKIEPDVRDAIESVRKIWNIGAHMEEDINLIIDVDPEEAQKLLELIEMLVEEWYIAKQKRKERTQKVIEVAVSKEEKKKQ